MRDKHFLLLILPLILTSCGKSQKKDFLAKPADLISAQPSEVQATQASWADMHLSIHDNYTMSMTYESTDQGQKYSGYSLVEVYAEGVRFSGEQEGEEFLEEYYYIGEKIASVTEEDGRYLAKENKDFSDVTAAEMKGKLDVTNSLNSVTWHLTEEKKQNGKTYDSFASGDIWYCTFLGGEDIGSSQTILHFVDGILTSLDSFIDQPECVVPILAHCDFSKIGTTAIGHVVAIQD